MSLTRIQVDRKMFAHDAEGGAIERESRCECGRVFRQLRLSRRFMEFVERTGGERATAAVVQQIPALFVPVHCPPCERIDLGIQARRDGWHHHGSSPRGWAEAAEEGR